MPDRDPDVGVDGLLGAGTHRGGEVLGRLLLEDLVERIGLDDADEASRLVGHGKCEEVVARRQLGHVLPVRHGPHRLGVGDHRLVEADAGAPEDEVTERDDAPQAPLVVDHVHVGEVGEVLVESPDRLDRLAGGHPHREGGEVRCHEAARGVGGVAEE